MRQTATLQEVEVPVNSRRTGKVLTVSLLGIGTAFGMRYYHVRWLAKGRAAFLAAQARRFDVVYVKPLSIVAECVVCILIVGVAIGVYEIVAWGITRAIGSKSKEPA